MLPASNFVRLNSDERVFRERGEGVVGLIGEDVAVCEEEDARAARWLARKVPATVKEFPRDLKGDEGLTRAGGEREQDAFCTIGDGLQHALDGDVLIVARLKVELAPI